MTDEGKVLLKVEVRSLLDEIVGALDDLDVATDAK